MPKKKASNSQLIIPSLPRLADLLGVSPRTLDSWRRSGLPNKSARGWDVKKIIHWLRTEGPWRPRQAPVDDPLMLGGDSPGLERYRLARAKNAEYDLAVREGRLIDRDLAHEMFSQMSAINRSTGKKLERTFGPRALEIFKDGFIRSERKLKKILSQYDCNE